VPAEPESIWNDVRGELRKQTPDFKFHIWLEPLELAAIDGRTLYVRAPEHIRSWVAERYLGLLRQAAAVGFRPDATVEIVDGAWRAPQPSPARDRSGGPGSGDEPESTLNPKYSFEQFVIGGGNRFAHAAALAVAELPAQAYNPLFLHGPPGLGKTHLLHAIGNYVTRYGSGLRVRYATVEEFTSAFVDAVRTDRTSAFKETFRRVDVVLIDDVQFLARKDRTREEFFHTFNALLDSGRQLVMTADRRPEELAEIEERLIERFRSGLVVELDPPDEQVRRAILHKRSRIDGVPLAPEVLEEIAQRVTSSVRALEGALIRVVAYSSLKGQPLTPALVRHVLHRLHGAKLSDVVAATASEYGVQVADLRAKSRTPRFTRPRHVAMYLAKEFNHQEKAIGTELARDRSSVIHGINKVSADLDRDPALREAVDKLRRQLS
jgi:chromosomal replication initiator protein